MFSPEYTITAKVLKNIGTFEYCRAFIDHTVILPAWENNLRKEVKINSISNCLKMEGIMSNNQNIKEYIDGIKTEVATEIKNVCDCLEISEEIAKNSEMEEADLKYIHKTLTKDVLPKIKQGTYRSLKSKGKTDPDELLAQMVEFFDWFNSIDAKETHPLLKAGITKGVVEEMSPFDTFNTLVGNMAARIVLKNQRYDLKGFLNAESYYNRSEKTYRESIGSVSLENTDFTTWLDYFTEGLAGEALNTMEKVKLLAKDTRVAKVTGRAGLNPRQEKIITYLQDYAVLKNQDFSTLFPDISEDTVLRDIKKLIERGVISKKGSTKSSYYELV